MESEFKTKASVSAVDVAEVARAEFLRIIGTEETENVAAMERWLDGIEYLMKICASEEEAKWANLADRLAGIVCPTVDWDTQPKLMKTTWQAVARHAVNCITAEDRDEFQTAREHDWRQWVLARNTAE